MFYTFSCFETILNTFIIALVLDHGVIRLVWFSVWYLQMA